MPGLFGGLPPGLRGYVAAEEMAQQRGMNELGMLGGVLGIQGQLQQQQMAQQMGPLQLQMLQQQIARQQQQQAALAQFGQPGQTALAQGAAVGDIGPTVTNAQRMTAQSPDVSPLIRAGLVPEANAFLKQYEVQNPKINYQGGIPLHERTGQPVPGAMTVPQTNQQGFSTTPRFNPGTGQYEIGVTPGAEGAFATQQGIAARFSEPVRVEPPGGGPARLMTREQFGNMSRPAAQAASAPTVPGISTGFPGAPGVASMGAEETAAAGARGRERAESGAKFEATVLDQGRTARNNLTTLQILAPNLDKLPTGPLFPLLAGGASYFKQFGIDVGELSKNLGAAQATDAVLKQLALKARDPAGGGMPGSLSDADRQFLVDTLPGLGRVPDGNRQLIQILTTIEQRKIDEAQIVNRMQADKKNTNEIRDALNQFGNSKRLFK